jgi:hypothetical protein
MYNIIICLRINDIVRELEHRALIKRKKSTIMKQPHENIPEMIKSLPEADGSLRTLKVCHHQDYYDGNIPVKEIESFMMTM